MYIEALAHGGMRTACSWHALADDAHCVRLAYSAAAADTGGDTSPVLQGGAGYLSFPLEGQARPLDLELQVSEPLQWSLLRMSVFMCIHKLPTGLQLMACWRWGVRPLALGCWRWGSWH